MHHQLDQMPNMTSSRTMIAAMMNGAMMSAATITIAVGMSGTIWHLDSKLVHALLDSIKAVPRYHVALLTIDGKPSVAV